jgi:hypothetical protein
MAHVSNRAAEYGSEIVDDALVHTFNRSRPAIAVRILEPTVINHLISNERGQETINIAYYDGASVDIDTPVILANITELQIDSGAVQVIFGEG